MKKFAKVLFVILLLFINGCSNEEVKPSPISKVKQIEAKTELLEKQVKEDLTIYNVKVEQPESPIKFGDKLMDETLNPIGIFEVTESKDGSIKTKLLGVSFSSNDDIWISLPKKWSKVSGRENTYSQSFHVKRVKSDQYDTSGVVTFTIVSPKDIIVAIEY